MLIGEENEMTEFKETTGERKEAMQSIVAILNKHCRGTIYFGIKDNGFVCGQEIMDSTKKDISRWIYDSIYPRITPTIDIFTVEDKRIIRVSFSGKNRPYSFNGEYLVRIGTENRRMTPDELKRLVMHADYSSKWEEEITEYESSDVDENSLRDFYESAVACGRLEMKEYEKEKLLNVLNLTSEDHLNNAGESLFGLNAKIGLKLATYLTDNKVMFSDLKLVNGNIYNLVNIALKYIQERINWSVDIKERKREEIPEIPLKALREIIVNAFAHADYETGNEIEIGIHPGSVEIYNPGTFPDDLTPFDFIDSNLHSFVRNRIILDVLFRSKDVEKSGTGFQRVNEICIESNVEWEFKKDAYGFFFKFIRKNIHKDIKDDLELTELESIVYDLIKNRMRLKKVDIAAKVGKSEKTIQRTLNSMIEKGYIVRVGSDKEGYWKIND